MIFADTIAALLENGALEAARQATQDQVKAAPGNRLARHLYIDLLILSGSYERADAQCNLATTLSPEDAVGFGLLRHQLRAMAAREAWFSHGAIPQFIGEPSQREQDSLRLAVAIREQAFDEAVGFLAELDALDEPLRFEVSGKFVDFLRDGDDRTPYILEVLTTGGGYLWVGFDRIAALDPEPLTRPRDYAFRPARLTLHDGASASVLLPAIYNGTPEDETMLLARQTVWEQDVPGLTFGRGQRCLLAGDELVPLHELANLRALAGDAGMTPHG